MSIMFGSFWFNSKLLPTSADYTAGGSEMEWNESMVHQFTLGSGTLTIRLDLYIGLTLQTSLRL